jgi:hypothetical protein
MSFTCHERVKVAGYREAPGISCATQTARLVEWSGGATGLDQWLPSYQPFRASWQTALGSCEPSTFLSSSGGSELPSSLASEKEPISGRQFSRNVAACTLARAAGQSPPTALRRRQGRPFTAGLAPARVSLGQGLLSLLGPTFPCRGRTCTCKYVKDRRLHIGIWFLARPLVLGAARVKENCFSLPFIAAPSCQSWWRAST